jgi:hypothetical protein
MEKTETREKAGRGTLIGLGLLVVYAVVLAAASVSEVFDLSWFDHPVFK